MTRTAVSSCWYLPEFHPLATTVAVAIQTISYPYCGAVICKLSLRWSRLKDTDHGSLQKDRVEFPSGKEMALLNATKGFSDGGGVLVRWLAWASSCGVEP